MAKRLEHVSKKKDHLMISKSTTRSFSKSIKNLEQIPTDLRFEIFSKLPWKSIVRFRCVSKYWNSVLQSSDFTDLFMKVSSSRPRLLFTVLTKDKWLFFSTPQALNPDNNSSVLTTDYHMCFPLPYCSSLLRAPINGLLCTGNVRFKPGCNDSNVTIYNPSTRQSIPLPIVKGRRDYARTYFGYDPINKEYKVLCLSMRRNLVFAHEVLTLGIKKPAWRMIECSLPRHYPYSPICINGVLYYLGDHGEGITLVCFDVRSEKFKFTEGKVTRFSKTINYKGKLGVFPRVSFYNGETKSIELLVLDDVEKNEWTQHIFVLPPLWKDIVADMKVDIVGMTGNGELVFSSIVVYGPLDIVFYNEEKNTIARVRIQGMESNESQFVQTFIDHVENVMLL